MYSVSRLVKSTHRKKSKSAITVKEISRHLFLDWKLDTKKGHVLEVQQTEFLRPLVGSIRRDHLHYEVIRKQSGEICTCAGY